MSRVTSKELAGCAAIIDSLRSNYSQVLDLVRSSGIADPALIVVVFDDEDRAGISAALRQAEAQDRKEDAAALREQLRIARSQKDGQLTTMVVPRSELVTGYADADAHPEELELLRHPAPPGCVLALYSGASCGHGVFMLGAQNLFGSKPSPAASA